MRRLGCVGVVVLLLCPAGVWAQSLAGVWQAVEVSVSGGPNAGIRAAATPNLLILTERHWATMRVTGDESRAALGDSPSDAELAEAYRSVVARGGHYELEGSTLTVHTTVDKDPGGVGGAGTSEVDVDGDRLRRTFTSEEGTGTTQVSYSRVEEPSSATAIEGVWRRVSMRIRGGSTDSPARGAALAGTYARSRPSLLIFTSGHFSLLEVRGNEERRPIEDPASDSELAAAYGSFRANAGRYELDGSTLRWHFLVDMDQRRVGRTFTSQATVDGEILALTSENADGTITLIRNYERVR